MLFCPKVGTGIEAGHFILPYLALLRVGFVRPGRYRIPLCGTSLSGSGRWALTPPFHPYPALTLEDELALTDIYLPE